jgi:chromosome partitioning protein
MYMITVVGGIKGGSGKTTLATNLTVLRDQSGARVLLVDADEQKSASDWAAQRDAQGHKTGWTTIQLGGEEMCKQLLRLSKSFDDIIVDVGGRDTCSIRSALVVADTFVTPFKPRSLDVWTVGSVRKMLGEIMTVNAKLCAMAVINQADSKGSDNLDALDVIAECPGLQCLKVVIGQRKAFGNAATCGLGVVELERQDKKATQEITELYEEVFHRKQVQYT